VKRFLTEGHVNEGLNDESCKSLTVGSRRRETQPFVFEAFEGLKSLRTRLRLLKMQHAAPRWGLEVMASRSRCQPFDLRLVVDNK